MRLLIVLWTAFLLGSCQQQRKAAVQPIYDFDSLSEASSKFAQANHLALHKTVTLNGQRSSADKTQSIDWKRELEFVAVFGAVNNPTLRDQYDVHSAVKDEHSNLLIKAIEARTALPVRALRKYYLPEPYRIRKVEAAYEASEWFYYSRRTLTLEFEEMNGQTALTHYAWELQERTFGSDTLHFAAEGTITTAPVTSITEIQRRH